MKRKNVHKEGIVILVKGQLCWPLVAVYERCTFCEGPDIISVRERKYIAPALSAIFPLSAGSQIRRALTHLGRASWMLLYGST